MTDSSDKKVRVTATTPEGDKLAEWTTSESGEHRIVKYVDKAMFGATPIEAEALKQPKVYLLSATPDPLGALAATCMMYEGKVIYDLSEVTDDQRRFYWRDIWNTTLQAPLEQIDLHFMVEGLTRASWDQMVRQRTANFAGESLRFSVKLPLTTVVRAGPSVNTPERQAIHDQALRDIEEAYQALIDDGVPAEDARGILPMNVLVRGHWKTNLRNLATELGKRTCTQAQWEWRMIALSMRQAIGNFQGYVCIPSDMQVGYEDTPGTALHDTHWQFSEIARFDPLWSPVCFKTGRCMFRAKADRGCTIRSRVEEGRFSEIQDGEWMLDPTAAWVR